MSTIFTQTLGIAALLMTALVCAVTLISLVIEQSEKMLSMQSALYEIFLSSLAEHIQGQAVESDSGLDEETT